MIWRIGGLALVLALAACVNPFTINPEQAERDARESIARGDYHIVGVCDFSCAAPGATPQDEQRLGVRFIENTSDTPFWLGETEYNDRARDYAARYNTVILAPHD